MSTALTTYHRFSDPLAAAAAVAVIVGGASVIGVAMSQSNNHTAPSAPSTSAQVGPDHAARIGLGDFTRSQATSHSQAPRGGHTMVGLP
jgi:hypothetical protein